MDRDGLFDKGGGNIVSSKSVEFSLTPPDEKISQGAKRLDPGLEFSWLGSWSQRMNLQLSSPREEGRIAFPSRLFNFR